MPKHDLDLADGGWRKYLGILNPGSLWTFKSRGTGGSAKYPGNFVPEIPRQLIPRYTCAGDHVVDLFTGSETTFDVAHELGRTFEGCDLRPHSARTAVGDARYWVPQTAPQMVFMHPPYADIIDYNAKLGAQPGDLSLPWKQFLNEFDAVAQNAYDILTPGGAAVLVIGDMYENGTYIPLGFHTAQRMNAVGFQLKAIHVKDFGNEVANKGKNANLWFLRALRGGFPILEHEYVFVFAKPVRPKKPTP